MKTAVKRKIRHTGMCKGRPGYSGSGRPSRAFMEHFKDAAESLPGQGTRKQYYTCKYKGRPGYSGRGKPSHEMLVKWGLAKPKPEKKKFSWRDIPGYSGKGPPSLELRIKYGFAEPAKKFSWSDAIPGYNGEVMPSDEVLLENGLARRTESGAIIKIKPKGVNWGEVIPEWKGKMGWPTRILLKKYGFASPSGWTELKKLSKRIKIVDGLKIKPPGVKWGVLIPKWAGHKGPAPRYLREKYGFARPKAEQEKKIITRADGLKVKPKGAKWGELIPEWKGRGGPPTRTLLEKNGFAPLSTWQEPKKKAPKQEKTYMGKQFDKKLIEDGAEALPTDEGIMLPDADEAAIVPENEEPEPKATNHKRGRHTKNDDRYELKFKNQGNIEFETLMRELGKKADYMSGFNRGEKAKEIWAQMAESYESKGLSFLAGCYFQKAGDMRNAASAFNACGEYGRAELCRGRIMPNTDDV